MKSYFTLLRHGQSQGNANGILQGQTDSPLDETGIQQAQQAARYWAQTNTVINLIISSPLSRARTTAEIIAKSLGAKVEFDPNLKERDWGQFQGKPITELHQFFSSRPSLSLFEQPPPDGESFWQLYTRAGDFLQQLLQRPAGEYLIVSHGGLLSAMHMVLMGIAPPPFPVQRIAVRMDNCAFTRVEFDHQQHRWQVLAVNAVPHLDGKP